MRKLIGSIALTLLAASIAGCAEEQAPTPNVVDKNNPFAELEQAAITQIAGTIGGTATDVTIAMEDGDIAVISKRAVDSTLAVNGYPVMVSGVPVPASGVKSITITGANDEKSQVVLDFSNGYFAKGSATVGDGIHIDLGDTDPLGTADGDTIGMKTMATADVMSVAAKNIKTDADAYVDVDITNDAPVKVYLGAGNDTVTTNLSTLVMSIFGGDGDDIFTQTTSSKETISGGAGNDKIDYSARLLTVTATMGATADDDGEAAEDDTLSDDIETVLLGAGDDTFTGLATGCIVTGNAGIDTITGGTGNDTITGLAGDDILAGGNGVDTVDGGAGNDTIDGGAGDDKLIGGDGNDTITGAAGKDTVTAGNGDDTIDGGSEDDDIKGEAGIDSITGGTGNDKLDGGTGDDTFLEGALASGSDVFTGGDGADTVSYALRALPVSVTLGAGTTNDGDTAGVGEKDDVKVDVENAIGGDGADTLTGSDVANELVGGIGIDTISGGKGDDSIEGGADVDIISCGDGIDFVLDTETNADCEFP